MQIFECVSFARNQQAQRVGVHGLLWFLIGTLVVVSSASAEQLSADEPPPITPPAFGIHERWPVYNMTQHMHAPRFDIHLVATPGVSEWMIRETAKLLDQMVAALKHEAQREAFAGHRAYLITDDDPSIPGAMAGHRNTGGDGYSVFNEALVCTTAVDTIRPDHAPEYRAWDTPVHEFGHAIEHTLKLEAKSDAVYSKHVKGYNPKVKREYFAWSVQRWFDCLHPQRTRANMPKWEYDYLASVFDSENTWAPSKEPRGPETYKRSGAADGPALRPAKPIRRKASDLQQLVGRYATPQPTADWHRGTISVAETNRAGRPTLLRWTNDAGVKWLLKPTLPSVDLLTGPGNPYRDRAEAGAKVFRVGFDPAARGQPAQPAGFWFNGGLYLKQAE